MNALFTVEGTISNRRAQDYNGKTWYKFDLTADFPNYKGEMDTVVFELAAWHHAAGTIGKCRDGQIAECKVKPSSREYNGKRYYDFRAETVALRTSTGAEQSDTPSDKLNFDATPSPGRDLTAEAEAVRADSAEEKFPWD